MNWLEILIALLGRISTFCVFAFWLSLLATVFLSFVAFVSEQEAADWGEGSSHGKKAAVLAATLKKALKVACGLMLVFALPAAAPSLDDLWRVRIGLIKFQLASPENIQKGADVIERIGQKLECKYLGCEKSEPKK